jgi:hypothetical protein
MQDLNLTALFRCQNGKLGLRAARRTVIDHNDARQRVRLAQCRSHGAVQQSRLPLVEGDNGGDGGRFRLALDGMWLGWPPSASSRRRAIR